MTRNDVLNSNALKRKFCKDCNIPISVFDNPYFEQRLNILESIYNCKEKFDRFCLAVSGFNSEQEYFTHYNGVKENVIAHIKNNNLFDAFIEAASSDSVSRVIDVLGKMYPKRNLYIDDNDDKVFISIDMIQGNFSALHIFCNTGKKLGLTNDFAAEECWEDVLERFTNDEHIIHSKYIRQVIFGACNPKQQTRYEKYLMGVLLNHILKNLPNITVFSYVEDEIIIEVDGKQGFSMRDLRDVISTCPNHISEHVRVEMFSLNKVDNTSGWMKSYYDVCPGNYCCEPRVEFKCLDADVFHQIVKYYYNQEIEEDDLVFYHNGKLAKYLEEVGDPWS